MRSLQNRPVGRLFAQTFKRSGSDDLTRDLFELWGSLTGLGRLQRE
jgi:hypothetical protein